MFIVIGNRVKNQNKTAKKTIDPLYVIADE